MPTIYELLGLASPSEVDPAAWGDPGMMDPTDPALMEMMIEAPVATAPEEFDSGLYDYEGSPPPVPVPGASLLGGPGGESLGIPTDIRGIGGPGYGGGRRRGSSFPRLPSVPRGPRRPKAPRAAKGVGLDGWEPGFADLLFLAFNPQALGLLQAIQGMKQAGADRQQALEDRKAQQEQYQRQTQMQDLQTRLMMDDIGGLPVEPGVVGDFRAGLGGRDTAETPVGKFSLPTPQQRREQAYKDQLAQEETKARIAARAAEIREKAKAAAEPKVPVSPELVKLFPQLDPKTTEMSARQAQLMISQYNALKPKSEWRRVIANQDGTLTSIRLDEEGKEVVNTIPGGPTRPEREADEGGLTPYQSFQDQKDRIKQAEEAMKEAQASIDAANRSGAEGDGFTHEKAWAKVQQAVKDYPEFLEGSLSEPGGFHNASYPRIQWKGGKRPTPAAPSKSTKGQSKTSSAGAPNQGADPRIGQIFIGRDGKRYKIKSIDADGDPIGVPVP